MQQCAILTTPDSKRAGQDSSIFGRVLSNSVDMASTHMPEAWVRGSALVRSNTLARGHSAVRKTVIETLPALLNRNMVPLVPLRGSISASGDLTPLSYIAGVLEGNPQLYLSAENPKDGSRRLIRADQALQELGTEPLSFGPKEALAVLNGTAVSGAVTALALHETHLLAVTTQILTAMGVEALTGSAESFNSFISEARPHPGQSEAAQNIRQFLRGSHLARPSVEIDSDPNTSIDVCQDRYALRTASQWIGPCLEDLVLAHKQMTVELNSSTDNPLVDILGRKVHHGGNFQAVSVTSAADKARSALQMMGKLLFAQAGELVNPALNNGLPPNLVADEPSLSYTMKGVDINMAAYTSELGLLAQPVGPHVQCAEMSNQSINSLALLSARYTHVALDVFSMATAAYLYMLCQALDLRVMQVEFLEAAKARLGEVTNKYFSASLPAGALDKAQADLFPALVKQFKTTMTLDSAVRFKHIAHSLQLVLFAVIEDHPSPVSAAETMSYIPQWRQDIVDVLNGEFAKSRAQMLLRPNTARYLGSASKRMYEYVRLTLGVPLHRGLADHPVVGAGEQGNGRQQLTGTQITKLYEALRSGELFLPVIACLADQLV